MLLYFNKLLAQHRSLRGALTSQIKKELFQVFGEKELPRINTQAKPTAIHEWKSSPKVRECYKKLFKPIMEEEVTTHMDIILENTWRGNRASQIQIAFAIGICEVILDPNAERIQMSESVMKNKIRRNLVGFHNLKQKYY